MDFDLSEEQQAFRDTLRRFVDRAIKPVAREWEQSGRYPTEIVEEMRALGLFGITIPVADGGLGLTLVDLAIVFEEISRGWMGIAGILGSHTLASAMIARHGTPEQRARYLPELATGARRTGIALTEAGAGSDLQGIQTRAWRDGEEWVIRGTKYWITNARYADPLPVLVKTDPEAAPRHRGMSVFLVPADSAGFTVQRDLPKLGYKGTESCEVVLDDVRVPADALLGGVEGRGMQQVLGALQYGRINIAARSVGVSQRAYEDALAYSQERHAFGQPISGFQAVQLKLADMATDVQAARLLDLVGGRRRAAQARRGRRRRPAGPHRRGVRDGQAVRLGGGAAHDARVDADLRRRRLLDRAGDRAPLPGRAAAGDRRGHQRHPAGRHRPGAAGRELRPLAGERPDRRVVAAPHGRVGEALVGDAGERASGLGLVVAGAERGPERVEVAAVGVGRAGGGRRGPSGCRGRARASPPSAAPPAGRGPSR